MVALLGSLVRVVDWRVILGVLGKLRSAVWFAYLLFT